jgi:YHS domain-containing protein
MTCDNCGVILNESAGIAQAFINGKTYYFCSLECMAEYRKSLKQ